MLNNQIIKITIIYLFLLVPDLLIAQTLPNLDLPPNTPNTRFQSTDQFETLIVRPILSIRGFDSSTLAGGTNFGLGLKQILERHFSGQTEVEDVVDLIIGEANQSLTTPSGTYDEKRLVVDKNTRITQSRAFVALATYVLEKNSYDSLSLDTFGKQHSQALASLKSALVNPPSGYLISLDIVTSPSEGTVNNAVNIAFNMVESGGIDGIRYPISIANMARALDLYLALENAYKYYADIGLENPDYYDNPQSTSTPLLTAQQRKNIFENFGKNLNAYYNFNFKLKLGDVWDSGSDDENIFADLIFHLANATDLTFNELQPGNWSLKNLVSIGYASLAMNEFGFDDPYEDYLNTAFRSTFKFREQDRTKYWSYQTENGKKFWAEGPYYFHLSLRELVPFWHAVRGSGMYDNGRVTYNGLSVNDPFYNTAFVNPLNWLADISTPDGKIPPLDDGNKSNISISSVLRWTNSYGDGSIGSKYAAINELNGQFGSDANLYLVELAIPRRSGTGISVVNNLTNEFGDDHQLIKRKISGNDLHYLLMNGERGDAVTRGEGHEQGDQLQMLYYRGSTSYIMDSGYDEGGLNNSTWNNYLFHNNLGYVNGRNIDAPFNGWKDPLVSIIMGNFKPRKVVIDHPVLSLNSDDVGNIHTQSGFVRLIQSSDWDYTNNERFEWFSDYFRDVLFIDGPKPYLIDLNSAKAYYWHWEDLQNHPNLYTDLSEGLDDVDFRLKYHVGSDSKSEVNIDGQKWGKFTYNEDDDLYIHMNFVEYNNPNLIIDNLLVRESNETTAQTIELKHSGGRNLNTVSFIQINETGPSYSPTPIQSFGAQPYQIWKWKQSSSVLDVLVKRDNDDNPEKIRFQVEQDGVRSGFLEFPSDKDYGFVRLNRIGNKWVIDSNYQLDISQDGYFFAHNDYISSTSYGGGSRIYLDKNATVKVNGNLQLQSGAKVLFDRDATLQVNSSGSITADGVTFQTIDGSTASADRWSSIKLLGDGNTFSNCNFEGAEKAIYSSSYANLVERSTFSNNHTAIYSTSDQIELRDVTMQNGSNGIISRGSGTVKINSIYNASGFESPSEISGMNTAIRVQEYGSAYVHHTIFSNNDYNAYSTDQGRLYAGKYSQDGSKGYNDFATANIDDIFNSALTSSGSTWTAQANYNYWGSTSSPPSSTRFSGSVDRNFPLTCNPTVSGEYCDAQGSGGGGGGGGGPCEIGTPGCPGPTPEAPPGSEEIMAESELDLQADRFPAKDVIDSWLNYIVENPDDTLLYDHLQTVYQLLEEYDIDGTIRQQIGFDEKLRKWQAIYLRSRGAAFVSDKLPDPADAGSSRLLDYSQVIDRLGRAAVLLGINDELKKGNYKQMQSLIDAWRPYVDNNDDKASLLAAKAVAWQQTGEFGKALGAYEAIEALEPVGSRVINFQPPDYSIIKEELADSMRARQQVKSKVNEVELALPEEEQLPRTFELGEPYPNPFNPTTVIPFSVPAQSDIKIEVYNMLGQQVAILTDRRYEAGTYQVTFRADHLASGVYFIRTELGNKIFTKKITLIK